MKCTTIISKAREEEVLIYAHEKTDLISEIERIVLSSSIEIIGYSNKNIIKLNLNEIYCFAIEANKIFAYTKEEKFQLKQRLYEIESAIDEKFVKINQSCIININKIERFNASIAGTLLVILKNGYKDYVSRRQMKSVKERIGLI